MKYDKRMRISHSGSQIINYSLDWEIAGSSRSLVSPVDGWLWLPEVQFCLKPGNLLTRLGGHKQTWMTKKLSYHCNLPWNVVYSITIWNIQFVTNNTFVELSFYKSIYDYSKTFQNYVRAFFTLSLHSGSRVSVCGHESDGWRRCDPGESQDNTEWRSGRHREEWGGTLRGPAPDAGHWLQSAEPGPASDIWWWEEECLSVTEHSLVTLVRHNANKLINWCHLGTQ